MKVLYIDCQQDTMAAGRYNIYIYADESQSIAIFSIVYQAYREVEG